MAIGRKNLQWTAATIACSWPDYIEWGCASEPPLSFWQGLYDNLRGTAGQVNVGCQSATVASVEWSNDVLDTADQYDCADPTAVVQIATPDGSCSFFCGDSIGTYCGTGDGSLWMYLQCNATTKLYSIRAKARMGATWLCYNGATPCACSPLLSIVPVNTSDCWKNNNSAWTPLGRFGSVEALCEAALEWVNGTYYRDDNDDDGDATNDDACMPYAAITVADV